MKKLFRLSIPRRAAVTALVVALALALPLVAFADQVVNNIDTTIDPALESRTITAGGSTVVGFYIQPSNTVPPDDASGCNATGANPATVNLSIPAGVTASPSSLDFTGCGVVQNVTFSSSTVGSYTISVASVTGGKSGSLWDTAPAAFTLIVNPPADTTPPVITPSVSGTLGNNGWYVSDVTVSWTVTDPESTVTSTSGCGSTTISADTSGTVLTCAATSAGGTNSQSVTIKRDATAPTISGAASPAPNAAGWNNTDVTVDFTCSDSLSGVASCGPDQTLSSEGASQSATGTAVDQAGNSATTIVSGINIDKTAPTISGSASPAPNAAGWNKTDVTVAFTCSDSLSGVASCSPNQTLSSEGASQSATGTAVDQAGNSATTIVSGINIDKTAPTISGSASPAPNAYDWNNTNVTVAFTCSDSLSGMASCGPNQTLSSEGAGQSATGTAVDNAGNSASATVSGINIDQTPPTVAVTGVTNGQTYTLGSVPTAGCSTTDGLSGVAVSAALSMSGGPVGSVTATCSGAKDKAGNTAPSVSVTYTVIYNWQGFFRPVDNPPVLNVARAGSAIPVKFSLSGYQGMSIFAVGYPRTQVISCNSLGSLSSDTIEETVTPGNSALSYDTLADQYVYVWKSERNWTGCRVLTVRLNDGSDHIAYFNFTR